MWNRGLSLGRGEKFVCPPDLQISSESHSASHSMCNGWGGGAYLHSVVKRWRWQHISANAEVESERSYASTPHIPLLRAQGQIYIYLQRNVKFKSTEAVEPFYVLLLVDSLIETCSVCRIARVVENTCQAASSSRKKVNVQFVFFRSMLDRSCDKHEVVFFSYSFFNYPPSLYVHTCNALVKVQQKFY